MVFDAAAELLTLGPHLASHHRKTRNLN